MSEDNDVVRRSQHRVGTVLRGKYRIDRILGIGGMATVYAATHRNQAQFAVKLLHPEISMREDVRTRFLREGYVANSVKHPGAVRVVDDDVAEDGAAFLVMELLEGSTVEELCDRCGGKLPLDAAVAIIDQLLDVLSAAHAKAIVHRDIKPANLFVTRDGFLKVLDFGIARARDAAATSAQGGTGTGMLLGTPAFMAPEQALAKSSDIDAQTDVWAAGATLFTLLAGTTVHDGENAPQLLIYAATVPARSLAAVALETPRAIAEVVDRALAFRKVDRWLSAAAMQEGLSAAWKMTTGGRPSRASLEPFFAESVPPTELAGLSPREDGAGHDLAVERSSPPLAPAATPAERMATPIQVHATARSPVVGDFSRSQTTPGVTTARPVSSLPSGESGSSLPMHRGPAIAAIALAAAVAVASLGWGLFGRGHSETGRVVPVASEGPSAPLVPASPSELSPGPSAALPPTPVSASAPSGLAPVAAKSRASDAGSSTKAPPPPTSGSPTSGSTGIPIQW
jgi:serine/threonine-protein kinase